MKNIFIILISLIIISCNNQEQIKNIKFVENQFNNNTISTLLPEDWEILDKDLSKNNLIFASSFKSKNNTSIYGTIILTLAYEMLNKENSAIDFIKNLDEEMNLKFPNTKIKNIKIKEYQNAPYRVYEYNLKINNDEITYLNLIFIKENIVFSYLALINTKELKEYEKTVLKIFESLKINNTTNLNKTTDLYKIKSGYYKNNELGISFIFPKNMKYTIVNNRLNIKKIEADKSDFFNVLVDVVRHKEKLNRTSKTNMEVIIDVFKDLNQIPKDKRININKFDHDLYNAYQIEFDSNLGEKELSIFVYSYFVNNIAYQVSGITDKEHRTENKEIFDKIFKSLKIDT